MAHELENYWFERSGRFCSAKPTGWPGRLITGLYSLVVAGAAWLLIDRTILGFVGAVLFATALFIWVIAVTSRAAPAGRSGRCW
jgi:hypothetical protein